MLRIIQNNSPGGAKNYYSTSDYYMEGQERAGVWRGHGAERLGLEGQIRKGDWDSLCDNQAPGTCDSLTPRQRLDRRVGYDFNFHVPKSVSVLYALTEDQQILDAFHDSVRSTMLDMETEMQTRVRSNGRNEDRRTGNMIWGEYTHFTARPVDGVPDPHLHAHCFVFNTTYDDKESRWKAGQFAGLKQDAPYFEAIFHSRLAQNLENIGLATERTQKGWDLASIPESVVQKFSRRTLLIEELAREQGITDANAKDELGAQTRQRKQKNLTLDQLQEEWRNRMSQEELQAITHAYEQIGQPIEHDSLTIAQDAVTHAIEHIFERSAVVAERKLLTEAMKYAVGKSSPDSIQSTLANQHLLAIEQSGQRMVTTQEVLREESRMLAFARNGRGVCSPLGDMDHVFEREWLNTSQKNAVLHVLGSKDRVVLIRGAAGTGKTSIMQETVNALETNGQQVFTFAPSADASRGVLRDEGFENADTVSSLLINKKLQEKIRNQVIWIDEAGLLSTQSTARVFELAEELNARIILSGDRRQHGSVERGAALKLLETEAGLIPANILEIQRQKGEYKEAVSALSADRTTEGFGQLDRMGWIKEIGEDERYKALAQNYLSTIKQGKTALVIAPTHKEGRVITNEIRKGLKESNRIGKADHIYSTLENANLTEAQRTDPVNYSQGDILVFHQNAQGYTRGQRVIVGDTPLPLDQANRFQVFRPSQLPIATGERVRFTRNGTSLDGKHRLNNGAIYSIKRFDKKGNMVLSNGWVVDKEYGHFAHGYSTTSHSSQGKTVDHVIIGQSSDSFPASSREQFYVSVSRGRQRATIYTDDKESLLDAVSKSDERFTATELIASRGYQEHPARRHQRTHKVPSDLNHAHDRQQEREERIHDR